jgi:hypothetical protein
LDRPLAKTTARGAPASLTDPDGGGMLADRRRTTPCGVLLLLVSVLRFLLSSFL